MNILHLTLKKKWFDMIASGEKKEEYREIKDYWVNRFGIFIEWRMEGYFQAEISDSHGNGYQLKNFDVVKFTNGYAKNAPSIMIEYKGLEIGNAKPEWSDNWQGEVFIIKLGEIINN